MKRLSTLAVAAAAAATSLSAHAVLLDARFSGTVESQTNTAFVINAPISGEFVYDTDSATFLSFTVGGQSVAPGYTSQADITPDLLSAIYKAQVSPVLGGTVNSTFTVDLEALSPLYAWPSNDAVALLSNAAVLASNLDTATSSFGYYTANADGTNISSVTATLTGVNVTAVPEPASWLMFAGGVALFGLRHLRRGR